MGVGSGLAAEVLSAASGSAGKPLRALSIDCDLCQGHAVCIEEAPTVFRIGQDGKVELIDAELPPVALHTAVRTAARYCPTGAMVIE